MVASALHSRGLNQGMSVGDRVTLLFLALTLPLLRDAGAGILQTRFSFAN